MTRESTGSSVLLTVGNNDAQPQRRSLRVLHVVRPAVGGMKEHLFELCNGLRDRGHIAEIACPRGSEVADEARALGFAVHEVTLVGPLNPLRDVRSIVEISRIVRGGSFDLVHAHGFKAGLPGRLGAALGGCRSRVVTVHNHVMYRDDISRFTKWRYRIVERSLARLTTRIITVSDSLRDELVDAYGIARNRVVTVRNGVDVSRFLEPQDPSVARESLDIEPGCVVVGTAARFAPQKGLGYFVEAAKTLCADRSDVVFVLGGDGPLRPNLEAAVDAAGIGEFVRMPGFIVGMPAFLAALDVFVSSSLSEGLPLTLVQVGAAALSVVATHAGGTPEIVHDGLNGVLVPPADAPALAHAVERLLDDSDLRERLGREGRRIAVTEFAPETMIRRTLDVYYKALSS